MRNDKQQLSFSRLVVISSITILTVMPGFLPDIANAEAKAPSTEKLIGQRTRLNDDVLRLSQPAKCKVDGDCAVLPMGVKPCGGPWKYVLYAKKNSKLAKLKARLADYNKLDQQINESQQTMSDCSMTVQPQLKCEHSMCIDSQNANAANAATGFEKAKPKSK